MTSLVTQTVKNPLANAGDMVESLGWEDPLEKELANYSSILAWRITWTEEPSGLHSMGLQRDGHYCVTEHTTMTNFTFPKDSQRERYFFLSQS